MVTLRPPTNQPPHLAPKGTFSVSASGMGWQQSWEVEGPSLRGRSGDAILTPHSCTPPTPLKRAGADWEEALLAPHPPHPPERPGRPVGSGNACSQLLTGLSPATLSPAPGISLLPPKVTPKASSSHQPGWLHTGLYSCLSPPPWDRGWGTSKGAAEGPQHERSI